MQRTTHAITVQFGAAKDTMIFQNNINNGAGGSPGFYAGTNSALSVRRGMIEFDVSSIPSTAVITNVQLRLVIGQIAGSGGGGGFPNPIIGLHKLMVDWGEADTGTSTATTLAGIGQGNPAQIDDATWNSRFFGSSTPWGQPGGLAGVDYVAAASASLVQGNMVGDVSEWVSTPALIADVQSWLGEPSSNHGWMLINADESAAQTFRGFYSRNFNPNNDPTYPDLANYFPRLTVAYDITPGNVVGDYNSDGSVNAADYTVWRDTFGSTTDLRANGDDSNSVIDAADYEVWKHHFDTSFADTAVISEPGVVAWAFVTALLGISTTRCRFRSSEPSQAYDKTHAAGNQKHRDGDQLNRF
jgi:hypothetical protein